MTGNTPSRRGLLATVAAVAAVGTTKAASAAHVAMGEAVAANSPDAEAIRICEKHLVNLRAYNAHPDALDNDEHPLLLAYEHTQKAIDAMRPVTLAGLAAKARVALAEAQPIDGGLDELWESSNGGIWAADLARDLIRIAGGVA